MTKDEALKLALEALENLFGIPDKWTGEGGGDVAVWRLGGSYRAQQAITAIKEALAQPEQEFFTHSVEQPYDWSEWVCPDPKGYLMKCCDCGLVHEAEFGVVRYKSESEREYCDFVDDPNLQAVFRMRRSEQWSPADMANRAGGIPMEQPEQEPVAGQCRFPGVAWSQCDPEHVRMVLDNPHEWKGYEVRYLYTTPPQRKPLTDEQATKAALWDLAVSKGLVTVHSEQLAPGTWSAHLSVASWIEGHDKACDISNEAAHGIKGEA